MINTTEELIEIFKKCEIKYRLDESYDINTDVLSVRIKSDDIHTDFAVFIPKNSTEASIQAVIGKTTPKERHVCLEILNVLNHNHKWIKYTIDDENLISAQIDVVSKAKNLAPLIFQLLLRAADFVIYTRKTLSESGVAVCVSKNNSIKRNSTIY